MCILYIHMSACTCFLNACVQLRCTMGFYHSAAAYGSKQDSKQQHRVGRHSWEMNHWITEFWMRNLIFSGILRGSFLCMFSAYSWRWSQELGACMCSESELAFLHGSCCWHVYMPVWGEERVLFSGGSWLFCLCGSYCYSHAPLLLCLFSLSLQNPLVFNLSSFFHLTINLAHVTVTVHKRNAKKVRKDPCWTFHIV